MSKTMYVCQNCSASYPKWQGQCGSCGEWNTLVEEIQEPSKKTSRKSSQSTLTAIHDKLVSLKSVDHTKNHQVRISTGIGELDRVLGGTGNTAGIIPGAVVLMGGEPGIGKSTLLTQVVINNLAAKHPDAAVGPILYVSGEESPSQIVVRIKRLLENDHKRYADQKQARTAKKSADVDTLLTTDDLQFITTTDVDELVAIVTHVKPRLLIVDSIQTVTTSELSGAPGSVGQVREAADRITNVAKQLHIPTFLIGHVTKEGTIAGPKVLEHIVDAVLELSGERTGQLRILRAIKNRFGATDEVGVFSVDEVGLREVTNPSEFFLEQAEAVVPGSATTCVIEGTRPILIEVQALVVASQLAMPRRVGRGIDVARIQVLAAVLQKHCRLPLGTHDIFLSAAGGYRVQEAGIDLGLVMALASSLKNQALPEKTVFIGEVGLLGEVRSVSYLDRRIKEAKRLGYSNVFSRQTHQSLSTLLKDSGLI